MEAKTKIGKAAKAKAAKAKAAKAAKAEAEAPRVKFGGAKLVKARPEDIRAWDEAARKMGIGGNEWIRRILNGAAGAAEVLAGNLAGKSPAKKQRAKARKGAK